MAGGPGAGRAGLTCSVGRAVVLGRRAFVEGEALPLEPAPTSRLGIAIPGSTMGEIERYAILTTLDAVGGSTTKAAEMLDLSVRTIQYRMHEYGRAPKDRGGPMKSTEKSG